MRATYETALSYYTRNASGTLVKTSYDHRTGFNAKAMHMQAQKDLRALMYSTEGITCVEIYTCLMSGEPRGYGQAMERSSYRHRFEDRWTHTDF